MIEPIHFMHKSREVSAIYAEPVTKAEVLEWLESRDWFGYSPAAYGPWQIIINGPSVRAFHGVYSE